MATGDEAMAAGGLLNAEGNAPALEGVVDQAQLGPSVARA